jgi:nucleoside-diphosphate-sugar epimerase
VTRVLVTGARGFVGRHVCAALATSGFDVHAVTSGGTSPSGTATWHHADLLDPADRDALLRSVQAEALVHLAWYAKPPHYWRDPENLQWVTATLELVRAFVARGGRRVVGAGTCAEYDWRYGFCIEQQTPLAPATLYGAAKSACGGVLEAFGRETGLSVAWARLFFLFGPHDSATRLVPSLALKMGAGEPARCTSGGHVRDFLYVADAAAALAALLDSRVTGPVNIASGVPVRIADVARGIAERVGRPDLLTIEEGPADHPMVAASVARLREEVGWRPAHDMAAALDETVRWWSSPEAREERQTGEVDAAGH